MVLVIELLVLLGSILVPTWASCPHLDSGLALFSTSGLGNGLTDQSDLVISTGVRLDVDLDVNSIRVTGTGKLVFEPGQDRVVRTSNIMIENDAQLVIGSDDCRFTDKVNIYLKGERSALSSRDMDEGEKFIAVKDNGVLSIHGEEKLHWTKLSQTVDRFTASIDADEYIHSLSDVSTNGQFAQGPSLYIFDSSFNRVFFNVYDIKKNTQTNEQKRVDEMTAKLDEILPGQLVAISVQNQWTWSTGTDLSALLDKIEQVANLGSGALLLRSAEIMDAFSLVFVKDGSADQVSQVFDPLIGKEDTKAIASIEYNNKKISAISYIKEGKSAKSYIDLRILNLDKGFPVVNVIDPISSWNVGDEVLLASSDYTWTHGEVRKIKNKIDDYSFTLDGELEYRHFGEVVSNVDMRVEVALLTRNIKIEGVMSRGCPVNNENCDKFSVPMDTFGAHIKILHSFGSVFIQGAELQFMGQATHKGFYPIHFHMCHDVSDKVAIIRRNSIHDTYARAVTVHGTYGVNETNMGAQIIENVAYNVFGHCYFLEDGAERATNFTGNLGAAVKNIDNGFATDKSKATIFWITNPQTIMVGNVGAGADPVGPSTGLVYQRDEARSTPLWRFDNNVVHSCDKGGMNFENILVDEDGAVADCMNYKPVENPLDRSNSPGVKVQLTRLTAYKNRNINTWLRGGWLELMQYSSAHSKRGVQLARGSSQQQFVKKSVFLGQPQENYEDPSYPDALSSSDLPHFLGIVFYDGPVFIDSTFFDGFSNSPNGTYVSGALGFKPKNVFSSSAASTVSNLRFGFTDATGGNRVFDGTIDDEDLGFGNFHGDESATFRDADGSVSKCPADANWAGPVQVVKPEKIILTERCTYRENSQTAACQDLYGKASIEVKETFSSAVLNATGQIRRVEFSDPSKLAYEDHPGPDNTQFMIVLGTSQYYYEYQFTEGFPKKLTVEGKGFERNSGAIIGICMPNGAQRSDITLTSKAKSGVTYDDSFMKPVSSLQELADDQFTNKYFLSGRMLYTKIETWVPRSPYWDDEDTDHCPESVCPKLTLEMNQQLSYTPCFNPTAEELSTDVFLDDVVKQTCDLPSTASESDWGAGAMLQSVDGQWGEWGSWSDCCVGGVSVQQKTRKRLCDNPTPFGDGNDCVGVNVDEENCVESCPDDGVLSPWSVWSDCFCDGIASGSYGAQTRDRSCLNQANFGQSCDDTTFDVRPCEAGCEYENV